MGEKCDDGVLIFHKHKFELPEYPPRNYDVLGIDEEPLENYGFYKGFGLYPPCGIATGAAKLLREYYGAPLKAIGSEDFEHLTEFKKLPDLINLAKERGMPILYADIKEGYMNIHKVNWNGEKIEIESSILVMGRHFG